MKSHEELGIEVEILHIGTRIAMSQTEKSMPGI